MYVSTLDKLGPELIDFLTLKELYLPISKSTEVDLQDVQKDRPLPLCFLPGKRYYKLLHQPCILDILILFMFLLIYMYAF